MSQLYAASSQKTDVLLPNNNIAHAPEHAAILPGLSAPRHSLDHKGENTPCAGASIEAKNLAQEGIRGRAKPSDSSLQLPVLDEAQVGFLPSFPQPGRVLTFSLSCLFPGRKFPSKRTESRPMALLEQSSTGLVWGETEKQVTGPLGGRLFLLSLHLG